MKILMFLAAAIVLAGEFHGNENAKPALQPIPGGRDAVTVLGKVQTPAVVPFREGIVMLEAISACRGLTDDANIREFLVVRGTEVIRVDASGMGGIRINGTFVAKGQVPLQRGDIVVVPRSTE